MFCMLYIQLTQIPNLDFKNQRKKRANGTNDVNIGSEKLYLSFERGVSE